MVQGITFFCASQSPLPFSPESSASISSHELVETWLDFQCKYTEPSSASTPLRYRDQLRPVHPVHPVRPSQAGPSRRRRSKSASEGPLARPPKRRRIVGQATDTAHPPEPSAWFMDPDQVTLVFGAGLTGAGCAESRVRGNRQDGGENPKESQPSREFSSGAEPEPDSQVDGSQSEQSTPKRYGSALSQTSMPPPTKRKSQSRSPSKASSTFSDTRRKRQALSYAEPPGTFGIPDLVDLAPADPRVLPLEVRTFLRAHSTGTFEAGCVPITPEIDSLLDTLFSHENIPAHARTTVTSATDANRALALFTFAHELHRGCLRNSRRALDEAAWYPFVRGLLSVEPAPEGSIIPGAPSTYDPVPTVHTLFLTVDATTKSTNVLHPPTNLTVKVDALVVFNPDHATTKPVIRRAHRAGATLNVFNDVSLTGSIVVLAVEVKQPGGGGGEIEAEYQLGVYGMKTLDLMRRGNGAFVPSVSVCGHTWSLHVTYETGGGEIVTHGPVTIGATDTVYGTLKIVNFVVRIKEWAMREGWEAWKNRLEGKRT